jgi:3' terminal RNA ribose 2'-O-methyltransferase Hen1
MLLTLTSTHQPATDLGFLLHKNPDRVHSFELSFGNAYVFYPEATEHRCTVALLLDIDPVQLVRGKGKGTEGSLEQYVNDRPYVASSFLSVAIGRIFGTALGGRSKHRPEDVSRKLPLEAHLPVVPCRGGEEFLRKLFEPLGYRVGVEPVVSDAPSIDGDHLSYFDLRLSGEATVHDLLTHLYVLIPVLDDEKHYWVGKDEIEKLVRHGEGWLQQHPEKNAIAHRYLARQRRLTREALARLTQDEEADADAKAEHVSQEEEIAEKPLKLNEQRIEAVLNQVRTHAVKTVVDVGCGEGRYLRALLKEKQLEKITGMDVSMRALGIARDRMRLEDAPARIKDRITLIQGSLLYRDPRLAGHDAALVVEVVEHLDTPRLAAFERVLFEFAQPRVVVLTTPNVEYNVKFETLPAGKMRHKDHRFEWTRMQFQEWAVKTAERFGYQVAFFPIGPVDEAVGAPTQMGVFTR